MNKKILISVFVLLLALASPGSATFTDDFSDGDITDWTIPAGSSWSATTLRAVSTITDNSVGGVETKSNASYVVGTNYYFDVTLNYTYSVTVTETGNGYTHFWYGANSTDKYASVYLFGQEAAGVNTRYLDISGMTFTAYSISENTDYRVVLSITGSNINAKLYDSSDTLLQDETSAYIYDQTTFDRVVMEATASESTSGGTFSMTSVIDDIVVSPVSASTSTSISFDADSYVVGDYPVISWTVSDADWTTWNCNIVFPCSWDVYSTITDKDGGINQATLTTGQPIFNFDIQTQTGSQTFKVDREGGYTANLRKYWATAEIIESDTMLVYPESPSYIYANASYPYKVSSSIPVYIGTGGTGFMFSWYYLDTVGYTWEGTQIGLSSGSGTATATFKRTGVYSLRLIDSTGNEIPNSRATTTVFDTGQQNCIDIATNNISLSASTYAYNDLLRGEYQVNQSSCLAGVTYVDVYNLDKSIVTAELYGYGETWSDTSLQQGDLDVYIANLPSLPGISKGITWIPGNNQLRLRLNNSATGANSTLAFVNFTLNRCNTAGYCLDISKNKIALGEKVFITYTVPEQNAVLKIINPSGKVDVNLTLNNVSASVPYIPKATGSYTIYLNDPSGRTQQTVYLEVTSAMVTPTAVPGTGQPGGQTTGTEIAKILTMNTFWAFIMTAGLMIFISFKTKDGLATSITGAMSLAVFTFVGWISAWIFFSIFVIAALLLAGKYVTNQTSGG